jgi:hypothetical protein
MFLDQPTNPPLGAIRLNRQTNRFEEFDGTGNWLTKTLGISGGGTGATDAGVARANLGIGTLGVQAANSVNITGGLATLNSLTMTGHITLQTANAYDIGTSINRLRRIYISGGAVAPVGADKWVPV